MFIALAGVLWNISFAFLLSMGQELDFQMNDPQGGIADAVGQPAPPEETQSG